MGCGSADAKSSDELTEDHGGGGGSSDGAGGIPTTSLPGAQCAPIPACDAPPPDPGPKLAWNHFSSMIISATTRPNHRGRDLFLNPGDRQWVIAKFAYGLDDKDLEGEQVDIYLLRDCGSTWEFLGSATTTGDGKGPEVEGVKSAGGRVFFEIPADKALGLGRHRVHLVVRGDRSSTDQFIEVVPRSAPMFVSDVDGTLTGYETEEFSALLTGKLPDVHPDAAKAFGILTSKGYHVMYLTARPEWLVGRTREFLDKNGFPPGIVHTTLGLTGASGQPAATFKIGELDLLAGKGLTPAWAFGNTASDADAYAHASVMPLQDRVFYQFTDTRYHGRRIESYTQLLSELEALPSLCH